MGLSTPSAHYLSPHCLRNTKHRIANRTSVVLPWSQDVTLPAQMFGNMHRVSPTREAHLSLLFRVFTVLCVHVCGCFSPLIQTPSPPLHMEPPFGLRGICRYGLPLGWLKERELCVYRSGFGGVQASGAYDFSVLQMSPLGMDIAKRGKSIGTDPVIYQIALTLIKSLTRLPSFTSITTLYYLWFQFTRY